MKVWDEVLKNADTQYSERVKTQNQLFEFAKLRFVKTIFPQKSKILEVGCGAAYASLYFAKRGNVVTCLDNNKTALNLAKNNFAKQNVEGKFIKGDAEKLPFENNQFDIVMSHGLLEHFEDPALAIGEMVRVLKPGGLFFADIVPNRFSVQSIGNLFNFMFSIIYWTLKLKPLMGIKKGMRNFKPLYYENSLSWQEYKKIINNNNIKNIKINGNRPYPRLTLPKILDKFYANLLKQTIPVWKKFDNWDNWFPRFWGAGWWFWGIK